MKQAIILSAGLALGCLLFQGVSTAHGGTYRGPGSSDPGGAGGGAQGPADTVSPSGQGSGAASSGGAAPAGAPGSPTSSGKPTRGAPASGAAAATAGDASIWELWWGFNKEPFMDLRSALYAGTLVSGSDDYFLGRVEQNQAQDRLRPSEEDVRRRVVPALLEVLAGEDDNDIVTGALIALAKIGDGPRIDGAPGMADRLGDFLSHANQEISETAAVALGLLAGESSIAILTDLLEDTPRGRLHVERASGVPWRTRAFAAYGLGLIGRNAEEPAVRRRIVSILVKRLESEGGRATPDVDVACLTSLGLVPLPVEPLPVESRTRRPESGLLGQIRWILDLACDGDRNFLVRAHAPTALSRLLAGAPPETELDAEVADFLLGVIGTHSKWPREVQASCVLALGEVADADEDPIDARIRGALLDLAGSSPQPQIRSFAVISLARIAGRPGCGQGSPMAATEGTRRALRKLLEGGRTSIRPWAGLALGVLGRDLAAIEVPSDPKIDAALRAALAAARAPEVVGALSIAVGLRGDQEAKGVLIEKLEAVRDDNARGYVALGLGLMGAADAVEPIQAVVKGSKYRPELLRQAAISLGLLGDKRITADLIQMLESSSSLSAQASVAAALGAIGDARSIDPLIAMLGDETITARARGFAAVALGIVADEEPIPWNARISAGINYRANTTTLTDPSGAGILDIL